MAVSAAIIYAIFKMASLLNHKIPQQSSSLWARLGRKLQTILCALAVLLTIIALIVFSGDDVIYRR